MGYWNYRLVYHPPSKYKVGDKEFDRLEYLAIHEVHYNDDEDPVSMTVDGIVIGDEGEDSLVSLKWILENQMKAITKPILGYEIEDDIYKEIDKEKQNDFSKSIETKKQTSSEDQ
jgi:hypothetical protein